MAVNKVIYGDTTLIDLTSDTVAADKILQGYTAHDKSGAFITGTYSSKNATITVTYSEDFYGTTITATNGTTTLTKTATSSGELVFNVSEGGTWIVSGVVEGSTYSERVDVTFEYSTPQLIALPNGSTATPVNSIPIWLECAMIRDKSYTTLSQVLADTDTLIALCADSNACDYMARSTNWASGVAADSTAMLIVGKYNYCANALLGNSTWASAIGESSYKDYVFNIKVPTMTSATAPSGTVDSNGDYSSGYYKWKAFNPSESYGWVPNHSGASAGYYLVGDWLSYDFGNSVCINYAELSYINTSVPNNIYFKIQGSNDDFVSDVHDLCSEQLIIGVASTTVTTKVGLENATSYAKHRVYISTNSSSGGGSGLKVQFYGRTPVSQDYTLIHSAVEDSIFYMDEGTPVALCTIASGDTEDVDMSSFVGQTLTLVSTVAKDPTNLSNDFSMNVRITPNITEIYLMPYGALYWWGSEYNTEDVIAANGWSYSNYSTSSPTRSKNKINMSSPAVGIQGIGAKKAVSGTKAYAVVTGITMNSNDYGNLNVTSTKASMNVSNPAHINTQTMKKYEVAISSNIYPYMFTSYYNACDVFAFWYE